MLKKVFGFLEQFNYLTDILWSDLRFDEIQKSAGLWPFFIQINQYSEAGGR